MESLVCAGSVFLLVGRVFRSLGGGKRGLLTQRLFNEECNFITRRDCGTTLAKTAVNINAGVILIWIDTRIQYIKSCGVLSTATYVNELTAAFTVDAYVHIALVLHILHYTCFYGRQA